MLSLMSSTSRANETEIRDLARAYEPERYLAATLAREPERAALIALAAFTADLVQIATTTTEPLLGEIRLQWWRDSLETLQGGGRTGASHADALGVAIKAYGLPVPLLIAMTEARAFDLYDDPMPDQAALDGYLAKTEAIPFELALRVLGVAAGDAGALATTAGRAFGLMRTLIQLPRQLARRRMALPMDRLQQAGITADAMLSGVPTSAIRGLIDTVAEDISATLAILRPQIAVLSKHQRTALLPLATVAPYLTEMSSTRRNPLRDIADLAPVTRVWRIAKAHLSGRI